MFVEPEGPLVIFGVAVVDAASTELIRMSEATA